MTNNRPSWLLLLGVLIGGVAMSFYQPKVDGQTAQEWQSQYQETAVQRQSLVSCLQQLQVVPAPDNPTNPLFTTAYYRQTDVTACLGQ